VGGTGLPGGEKRAPRTHHRRGEKVFPPEGLKWATTDSSPAWWRAGLSAAKARSVLTSMEDGGTLWTLPSLRDVGDQARAGACGGAIDSTGPPPMDSGAMSRRRRQRVDRGPTPGATRDEPSFGKRNRCNVEGRHLFGCVWDAARLGDRAGKSTSRALCGYDQQTLCQRAIIGSTHRNPLKTKGRLP